MQYNRRVDAGCTVLDPPYALEDRLALKDHTELLKPVEYWAPASTTRSLNAPNNSLLVLPCLMKPDLVPPVMFGPNITGYLCKSDFSNDTSYTGVFSQTERGSAWSGGSSGYENTWDRPYFSARASNSAYGSSSVVQPASIRMMLCIKI